MHTKAPKLPKQGKEGTRRVMKNAALQGTCKNVMKEPCAHTSLHEPTENKTAYLKKEPEIQWGTL